MKFLGDLIFYVKNTKDMIRYDMRTKSSKLIGSTRDSVITIHVTKNKTREFDVAVLNN